jgi:glycosyltransferase involved in cell wall biosynthesis
MRIGFDVRPFLKKETGVGVYMKNLLFSLSRTDVENEYYLFSSSLKDRLPRSKIPRFKRGRVSDLRCPVKAVNFLWYRIGWPPLDDFFGTELDLTHSPHPLVLPTKGKKIVTVHDLYFMDFPERTQSEAGKIFRKKIGISLCKAEGVVCVSQFTARQVSERFPLDRNKVIVIYHGIDKEIWRDVSDEEIEKIKQKLKLPFPFLLFVGALEPRKNLLNLLTAFKVIRERGFHVYLVLAGPDGLESENIQRRIEELGLGAWVRRVGHCMDKELMCIYRSASAFVFPSLCEGFGLPLLEAMASDLPIAASKTTAIPEVAGDAAVYFDPEDTEDMADKIIQTIEDEETRQTLISKGRKRIKNFDWSKTASETLVFYRKVVQEQ